MAIFNSYVKLPEGSAYPSVMASWEIPELTTESEFSARLRWAEWRHANSG